MSGQENRAVEGQRTELQTVGRDQGRHAGCLPASSAACVRPKQRGSGNGLQSSLRTCGEHSREPWCSEPARGSPQLQGVGKSKKNVAPETFQRPKARVSWQLQQMLSQHLRGAGAKPGAEMLKGGDVGSTLQPRWAEVGAAPLSAYIMPHRPISCVALNHFLTLSGPQLAQLQAPSAPFTLWTND